MSLISLPVKPTGAPDISCKEIVRRSLKISPSNLLVSPADLMSCKLNPLLIKKSTNILPCLGAYPILNSCIISLVKPRFLAYCKASLSFDRQY
ncbi:Uncharacterised protein [Chlamydia trachomatis]|nr:Uncharacterised protein [Chlamydia trachomatis]